MGKYNKMDNRRWPRVRQKGVKCSVEGCEDWCVGNDLCARHNAALRRYGSVHGKPYIEKECDFCGNIFKTKLERARYCSKKCYNSVPEVRKKCYEAVKRYRLRKLNKTGEVK